MADKIIEGTIPILATPFTDAGDVDPSAFRKVIDLAITEGCDAVAMFGLASEFYKLTDAERTDLTRVLIDHVGGRVPVVVSITHHSLEVAVREAAFAAEAGADALMVLPPFFLGPGPVFVLRHIEAIASAVEIPVIVQYAPLQTGVTIDADAFVGLQRRHGNLTHVKVDLVPAGPMITALAERSGGSIRSLVGYLGLGLPEAVARGVAGSMPTASLAGVFSRMYKLLREDPGEGRRLHTFLLPLLNFMMQSIELMIACEKYLLWRRGVIPSARCRSPFWQLDAYQIAELDREIARLGIVADASVTPHQQNWFATY